MALTKNVRRILLGAGILVVACAAGLFWASYKLSYDLRHISFNQTEFEPFVTMVKAATANVLVIRRPIPDSPAQSSHYQELDQQADARLFDAWHAAAAVGDATFAHTRSGNWVTNSADAGYLPAERRLDPWNHSFCLLRRDDVLLILSAGPQAKSSPICKDIRIASSELASLPVMRLIQSPAGNLILMMREKSAQHDP